MTWVTKTAFLSIFLFALAIEGAALRCQAALGGDEASIAAEARSFNTRPVVTPHPGYTTYEIVAGAKRIDEYTDSRTGRVFAVSWRGRTHPNLSRLLGQHLNEFKQAFKQAKHRRGRAPVVIDDGNLHIEMGGRMMQVYGRVWLKDQIPPGVDIANIL